MGLLDKFFGGDAPRKTEKKLPWIPLQEIAQLDAIKKNSSIKPQVIFKHSTRCGISSMVYRQFTKDYTFEKEMDLYYLDLLNYRDISNAIASTFQLVHESPQILVIKNNVLVAHASHGDINTVALSKYI